ncbi:MAG: maleylpyruvate isomerase N-terminal domain-containing protein [Tepidiformaceae bacterium]
MAEDKAELLAHYAASGAELNAALAGLTDAQLTEPSLDGWSVKDHLAHLALWHDFRADEVERISAGHDSAWRLTYEQDVAINDMAYEARKEHSLAQVRWEFERSRGRLITAIEAATPRGLDGSLYGEAALRSGHETEHAGWFREWRAAKGI